MKKETQQLREFEESLVSQYKFYLEDLEQTIKGTLPPPHSCSAHTDTRRDSQPVWIPRLEAEEEETSPGGELPVVPRPGGGVHPLPV